MAHALCAMPSLVHAVSWWLAGLFAGAWWHTVLPWLLLAAAAVVCVRVRRVEPLLLPAALGAAWSAGTRQQACRSLLEARLQRGDAVWIAVQEMPVSSGRRPPQGRGVGAEQVRGGRCTVPVSLHFAVARADSVPRALPTPGQLVRVHGHSLRTTRGLRITAASADVERMPPIRMLAWRAALGQTIDATFRQRAPLVRALLIADQQGIDPEVRDRYADAGLVHLLSVSGLHVAIIAGALLTIAGAARLPRAWSEPAAMVVVAGYVLLLGCPAPAVRSAVMLGVISLSARLQRPVHEWTALALGAVVPTTNPLVVHDLGWQLSVGGMAALVASRALRRRWKAAGTRPLYRGGRALPRAVVRGWSWWHTRHGTIGWLTAEITTGVVATLITLPIIAWTFGRVSLVAPLSNVLAGPVVSLLQPALFLALLWALLLPGPQAALLADATQPLMALLDHIADTAAAVPGAVWPVAPTLATAAALGVAAALVVRGTAARDGRRWYMAAAAASVLALWGAVLVAGTGQLELHVLDVGQGDALALRTPRGRWVVVDAGRRWRGGDAGRRTVVPYLRRLGGPVALFVMSHPHDDHAGGAASVVRALRPALWWEPAFVTGSAGYRDALEAVRETGTRWERVHPGRRFVLDEVVFTVLAPDSAWTVAQHEANETSVVLRVQYGAHRLLLTGDAERAEEAWLLARLTADDLAADVLKIGHHGSRTSSSPPLLDAVAPRLAIASVGAGNRYGHPAPETLAALLARDIPVLRTDHEGTIVLTSDGRTMAVAVGADRWIIPTRRRAD